MIKKLKRSLLYGYRIIFPDTPTAVMLRCLTYIDSTNQKWLSRGSDKGLSVGHYFEFGVWNGVSLKRFWECTKWMFGSRQDNNWQIYGFDSFEGLPEAKGTPDLHEFVGKGSFKSTGITDISNLLKKSGCENTRLKLVSGYFDESLTEDLKNDLGFPKASIVNIDVDYYSSTIDVLNWIEDLLYDGSLIYFDDINFYNRNPSKGQVKAINEFNGLRKNAGLAAMPGLDRFERVYVYWRNDNQSNENLKF